MTVYLDTSTVLRALLDGGDPLVKWGKWDRAYSSEVIGVEARRSIDCLHLERVLDDEGVEDALPALNATERAIYIVPATKSIIMLPFNELRQDSASEDWRFLPKSDEISRFSAILARRLAIFKSVLAKGSTP